MKLPQTVDNKWYEIVYGEAQAYGLWDDTESTHSITAREAIGMVKLMYRCSDTMDIEGILNIMTETEYSDSDRSFLNKVRSTRRKNWMVEPNGQVIRERVKKKDRVMILDLDNEKDNKWKINDPQELALNNRRELLESNLFIVVESEKEKVHIVKSRYFNT